MNTNNINNSLIKLILILTWTIK